MLPSWREKLGTQEGCGIPAKMSYKLNTTEQAVRGNGVQINRKMMRMISELSNISYKNFSLYIVGSLKIINLPWLLRLSGLSAALRTKGSQVGFPVKAHACVAGQVPSRGHARGSPTLMFLSLFFSLPSLSLKVNKIFTIIIIIIIHLTTSHIYLKHFSGFPLPVR